MYFVVEKILSIKVMKGMMHFKTHFKKEEEFANFDVKFVIFEMKFVHLSDLLDVECEEYYHIAPTATIGDLKVLITKPNTNIRFI